MMYITQYILDDLDLLIPCYNFPLLKKNGAEHSHFHFNYSSKSYPSIGPIRIYCNFLHEKIINSKKYHVCQPTNSQPFSPSSHKKLPSLLPSPS